MSKPRTTNRRRSRLGRTVAAVLLGAAVAAAPIAGPSLGAETPARAEGENPNWYLDALQIKQLHDAGLDGSGITIAVIDGQINLAAPSLRGADITVLTPPEQCFDESGKSIPSATTEINPESQHGTSVSALIVGQGKPGSTTQVQGIAPKAKLLFISIPNECFTADGNRRALDIPVKHALDHGADIVSMSYATDEPISREVLLLALKRQVPLVFSGDNADTAMPSILPFLNGVLTVASDDAQKAPALPTYRVATLSAPGVDVAGEGYVNGEGNTGHWGLSTWSGASAATPIAAGSIALAKQHWKDASMNQIEQLAIATAGGAPATPAKKRGLGYGRIDPAKMIATNPAKLPDRSPLFNGTGHPTQAEVDAAIAAELTPSPKPTEQADEPAEPMPVWVMVGYGAIALFLIAGGIITFAIVSASRSRSRLAAIAAAESAADAEYWAAENRAGHEETARF